MASCLAVLDILLPQIGAPSGAGMVAVVVVVVVVVVEEEGEEEAVVVWVR